MMKKSTIEADGLSLMNNRFVTLEITIVEVTLSYDHPLLHLVHQYDNILILKRVP